MAGELLYGFHQLKDVLGKRVNDVSIDVVNTAIEQATNERQRQLDALLSLFVTKTTKTSVRYQQYARTRSQPLDQNGRALPIKPAGSYDVAFPLHASGNAWGANYVTRELMTVQDANDITRTLLDGDTQWMSDHVLAALVGNTTWSFTDEQAGSLTIQPLANNDSVTYALMNGASGGATDNHYLAQAASIADATNPFPTIYRELTEHPENSGDVVVFVASNLIDSVLNLATFKERTDPNIRVGIGNDELVGTLGAAVPGVLKGYVSECWIVEWAAIPSDYMIAVTTGGDRSIAMREFDLASLQGFKKVGQRDDHPFYESQYARWAGFGAWNRVGALSMRIGNASYAIPTNFTSPMP